MNQYNKILLAIGVLLVCFGLFRSNTVNNPSPIKPVAVDNIVVVTPPLDKELKNLCEKVTVIFLTTGSSDSKQDAKRLSNLYMDLATLIELDGSNEVVKTTEEIRQANSLSGTMLQLNIKGSYTGLSEATSKVISSQVGDDIIPLTPDLRNKAANAFRGLAWACNEGSK